MNPELAQLLGAVEVARTRAGQALETHLAAVAEFDRAARIVADDHVGRTLEVYGRAVQDYVDACKAVITFDYSQMRVPGRNDDGRF